MEAGSITSSTKVLGCFVLANAPDVNDGGRGKNILCGGVERLTWLLFHKIQLGKSKGEKRT